jgi:excisionase family DNA binding protein
LGSATSLGRVLGVDQLATIFHCSTEKIKRMARQGALPAFKLGKVWYVREEDLERYLASQVHSSSHLRRDQENHE